MYELFTLGGGTYLVDLLNAVAAITGGGAFVDLAQLAGIAGLAWVLFRTAFGGSWKDNAKWMLLFVAVWGAMIVPKATVRVVDRLDPALAPAVVANVPIGLALFASVTSQVGDGLTRLTEQAFALPNDLAYRRHGLIFGARLADKATRLEVTDAVFARNIRNYARQCIFPALLLGHVSADDLRESTDIWRLVTATGTPSAGASPARMVEFATRQPASGTGATTVDRTIVTCRDAAGRLNALWNAEIARAGTVFGRRIFPDARTEALARAELLAALPAAHDFLIGASRSAGEIMRQQMVLNAVHDAGEQWAAEAGNAAALRAYTEARAEAQTVSAYRAIGRQAETWVPLLRIVFECLYVGAFPMAVLLMLTPAGGAIFRSYVTGLVWLQSWGPLYAVLHRISMGEAAERMGAAAAMPNGDIGISLVAQAGIRAVAADVAVMSGYLSMSVPFLAAALAYGLSKATVLATSVLAVGQDAASSAAHEGTTGNLSLANTGYDTHRFATLEGRQIRTSAHVDTDRYTGYAPAGAGFTVTGDGTAVADAGAATSRIPAATARLSESLATRFEQRADHSRSLSRHWSAEAGTARNAAVTDATALIERYSHDVSTGEAFARGVTETESAQAQQLDTHVEKLSEITGLTRDQAAALTGEAKVGGSWDLVVKLGAEGSAMWRGQTIESEAWNRVKEYDRQHGVTETWGKVAEASRRYSTQTGDTELASLDETRSVAVGGRGRHDHRAGHRHGELGELRIPGEEGGRPDRLPGVVDVHRHLVGHRAGGAGKRRVPLPVRPATVLRGGVVGEDALAGADGGADGGRRPVVLRPERADQRLGGLAGVEVLAVDPLRERAELGHGLGDHRRDGLQRQLEGEAGGVLRHGAGEGDQLVRVDEGEGARKRVDAAAAGAEARQVDGRDLLGTHRRPEIEIAQRPVARSLAAEGARAGDVHRRALPEAVHLREHVGARRRGGKQEGGDDRRGGS